MNLDNAADRERANLDESWRRDFIKEEDAADKNAAF